MDNVKDSVDLLVAVVALIAALAGFSRWIVHSLDARIESALEDKLEVKLEDKLGEKMTPRFDAVGQRFDAMDQRFEAVDKRFDAVDQRFEAVDKRFDAMDQRLGRLEQQLETFETVTDIRLKALEGDVHLIKDHLLGRVVRSHRSAPAIAPE
jgi:hypothetical protein